MNGAFLESYYLSNAQKLFDNYSLRKKLFNYCNLLHVDRNHKTSRQIFFDVLHTYIEEAKLTLSLIHDLNNKKKRILEIGGGIGLVYGFLTSYGYQIYSLEPKTDAFNYYDIGLEIFKILNIDSSRWYPLKGEEAGKINTNFDTIISNNVLEHIINLEQTLIQLVSVLKPHGFMIHNTVNYLIPYEPHLHIPLLPFFPQHTVILKPDLNNNKIWRDLHFVNYFEIKRLCRKYHLLVTFKSGILLKTFERFDTDPVFAKRQKFFVHLYYFLKKTHVLNILHVLPPALVTPMQFYISRNKQLLSRTRSTNQKKYTQSGNQ
jgi:2-polyprenyl-3-methyl-5-hydroxy-6-metoxy-1,4-benzoquinol methylase